MSTRASHDYERNKLLRKWASRIDSSLHAKHVEELQHLKVITKFQSIHWPEECIPEFIPVGSCVEGSKVNIPGDIGDIDVLVMSNKVIMKEELFEYVPGYPAFLCIPVINEHSQYFRRVHLVERKYLPVYILKDIHRNLFHAVKAVVRMRSSPQMENNELRYAKESAVGVEVRILEGIHRSELGVRNKKTDKTVGELFCEMENAFKDLIRTDAKASAGKFNSNTTDFTFPEFDNLEKIRKTNAGENVGSSMSNLFNSNQDKYKQIMKSEDENILFTEQDDSNDCFGVTDDYKENQYRVVSTPLSSLHVSHIEDDELDIRYENNLEVVSEIEEGTTVKNIKRNNSGQERFIPSLENARDDAMPSTDTTDQKTFSKQTLNDPGIPLEYSNIVSIDFVPALKIDGWPKVAEEWITRKRSWPSIQIIDKICQTGCQVVVKHLPHMTKQENVKHFRLSFAMSELILANSLNDTQKSVWRILKAYQKAYLSSEPKVLSSYHWKNVIFWICEISKSDFWLAKNVLNAVEESLDFMIECLTENFLPQYFVREMNLLIDCDSETIELVKQTVIAIREEPVQRLKMFIRKPPPPKTCLITLDEIKQVQNCCDKQEHLNGAGNDMLDMYIEAMKVMNDNTSGTEKISRFVDGARDLTNELKSSFMTDMIETGSIDDPETKLPLQFLDTFTQNTELIDPRKERKIDLAKYMTNISNLFDNVSSIFQKSFDGIKR